MAHRIDSELTPFIELSYSGLGDLVKIRRGLRGVLHSPSAAYDVVRWASESIQHGRDVPSMVALISDQELDQVRCV